MRARSASSFFTSDSAAQICFIRCSGVFLPFSSIGNSSGTSLGDLFGSTSMATRSMLAKAIFLSTGTLILEKPMLARSTRCKPASSGSSPLMGWTCQCVFSEREE